MKVGRRLSMKVLNAQQVRARPEEQYGLGADASLLDPALVTEPLDLAHAAPTPPGRRGGHRALRRLRLRVRPRGHREVLLGLLRRLPRARQGAARARTPAAQSARAAFVLALSVQLRLLAPFLPYVTEEAWSWWQDGSIHRAAWPDPERARHHRGRPRPAGHGRRGARRHPRREVGGQGQPAHRGQRGVRPRLAGGTRPADAGRSTTSRRPAGWSVTSSWWPTPRPTGSRCQPRWPPTRKPSSRPRRA